MVNLNASRKTTNRSNGGGYTPMENILVQVKEVFETDAKKPNPEKDRIEAYLLHDAAGITAEFDKDGNPTTVISARIDTKAKGRYTNPDPSKTPLEMWDLKVGRKKGTSDRMGEGGLVVLEKAKKVGDREFEVAFLYTAQRNPAGEKELVIENVMATVAPEGEKTLADGSVVGKQERRIYLAEEAKLVTNMDELRAAIAEKLEDARADRPFAIIHVVGTEEAPRVVENDDGTETPRYPYEARTATVYPAWENNARLTSDQAFDRWLAAVSTTRDGKPVYERDEQGEIVKDAEGQPVQELRNGEMIQIINNYLGEEGLMFEVIGGFTYGTGKNSLPSAKNRKSDHYNYEMDWENRETGETAVNRDTGKNYVMQGLARSHMILGRVEEETQPGVYGPWYAQKTYTTRSYNPQVFLEREIITPNTPPAIAKLFLEQAERRSKAKNEEFRTARGNNAGAVKEDDEIRVDNEPDYSGAMSMSR